VFYGQQEAGTPVAAIIVPVGFDNGPRYDPDATPGAQPEYYPIVKGAQLVPLPLEAYEVWQSAHVDAQAHASGDFTRDRLVHLAARPGRDTAEIVERLLKSDLLVEYEIGTPSAIETLQTHRLFPTGEGMGNTDAHPETFRIGRNGDVLVEVINEVHTFWAVSFAYPSIWQAVLADSTDIPPGLPYSTAEELGQLFAAAIPMIVATHVGVLAPV
jgi:hypothetical protein